MRIAKSRLTLFFTLAFASDLVGNNPAVMLVMPYVHGTNPEALPFDDQRRRSYVLSRNNRKMVMMRIFDPNKYEEYATHYNHTVTLKGEPTTTAMNLLTD